MKSDFSRYLIKVESYTFSWLIHVKFKIKWFLKKILQGIFIGIEKYMYINLVRIDVLTVVNYIIYLSICFPS